MKHGFWAIIALAFCLTNCGENKAGRKNPVQTQTLAFSGAEYVVLDPGTYVHSDDAYDIVEIYSALVDRNLSCGVYY